MSLNTTAVFDRLDLDADGAMELLGVPESQRALFTIQFNAAKQAADNYCNNEFLDEDGAEAAIPDLVKMGVLMWLTAKIDLRPPGLLEDVARDLRKKYASDLEILDAIRKEYWCSYRFEPGF